MVLQMKRPNSESLAAALGILLARRYQSQLRDFAPDFIVPIPMHWMRRTSRGANHAEWLARAMRRAIPRTRVVGLLLRKHNTLPQKDLGLKERFRNLRSAFGLRAGYDLQGARILLVDDILTTGATCSSAAEVLKQAGASRVAAAVVGRAEGPGTR
jgi:ComF family protein